MQILDKRKIDRDGNAKPEPEHNYDDFLPTLEGCKTVFDAVLLRELKLPDEGMIATPDAYAEPTLFCEVIAIDCKGAEVGDVVRILKGIGTTIDFADADPGQRYFTVHAQDILCKWAWK